MTENLLRLAKPEFDICLCTNTIEPILAFWENEVGLVRDEILPIRPGLTQHHYPVAGSVIKINHHEKLLAATRRFFDHALGLPTFPEPGGAHVPVGESALLLTADPTAALDPPVDGLGWRFLTLQIFDAYGLYDLVIERGGRPGLPPKTLGDIAKYALVRDIDGNWIELSQRASLTGPF